MRKFEVAWDMGLEAWGVWVTVGSNWSGTLLVAREGKRDAIQEAKYFIYERLNWNKPSQLIVRKKNGEFQYERTYPRRKG